MNLINKKVTHKSFGEGKVVNQQNTVLEIAFGKQHKKFVYPDVFEVHLKIADDNAMAAIQKMIAEKRAVEKQQEQDKQLAVEAIREQRSLEQESDRIMRNLKLHAESQLVVQLTKEEAAQALSDWTVFMSQIKSGVNKGKPNKPSRLHENSAVLLTTLDEGAKESERRIVGMYMTKESFIGKHSEDGEVPAHSKLKIALTEKESKAMPFWAFYYNKKTPDKINWGAGDQRYFDNEVMAQILRELVNVKRL